MLLLLHVARRRYPGARRRYPAIAAACWLLLPAEATSLTLLATSEGVAILGSGAIREGE